LQTRADLALGLANKDSEQALREALNIVNHRQLALHATSSPGSAARSEQ